MQRLRAIVLMVLTIVLFPVITMAAPSNPTRDGVLRFDRQPNNISITTSDASRRIELEVEAKGGSKPYTYTWYQGTAGDTSTSVANTRKLSPTLTPGEYSFWARVSDASGATADTRTISVSIRTRATPTPMPLTIASISRNVNITTSDASKKIDLEVEARGGLTPYSYAWYQGATGDTSTNVGSGKKFSPMLTAGSYSYWAQATDARGNTVDSTSISVVIAAPATPTPSPVVPLSIKKQTGNISLVTSDPSKRIELKIEATGGLAPYSYTWYNGAVGDTSTIVGTRKDVKVSVTPGTTQFWAQVVDANGDSVDSSQVNVTIAAPSLRWDREPRDTTVIWRGSTQVSTTLTAKAKGGVAPLTYSWSLAGIPVASSPALVVTFTSPTDTARLYNVTVTDALGASLTSRTATVIVKVPDIRIIAQPRNRNARWDGNDAVTTISAMALGGYGTLDYTWYTGTPTAPGDQVGSGKATTIRIPNATSGTVSVFAVISDSLGNSINTRVVSVLVPVTPVPSVTPVPTNTLIPTLTPTDTAVPTATDTAVPTATDTAVPTATDTAVPTATDTAVPTATDTAVPTATDTAVPTATDTAVPTPTI